MFSMFWMQTTPDRLLQLTSHNTLLGLAPANLVRSVALSLIVFLSLIVSTFGGHNLSMLHQKDIVLFQGDSITDAGRQRSDSSSMGEGYAGMLAAQIGKLYPERQLKFLNRGVGGDRVTDLAKRWHADTLDLKPNFLSILVGINDALVTIGGRQSIETFEQVYDKLLADTLKTLPNVRIVLGEPFLLPVSKDASTYAAEMAELKKRQAVVERLATKYGLPLVRYQKAFDEACRTAPPERWAGDGVHPTSAGYGLMAEEWLKTVNHIGKKG